VSAIVQLSDPHLGATWNGIDPRPRLERTVGAVAALRPRPDAVLVTGDLAEHGAESEYADVREALASLAAPVHVLPGNHDDRAHLRAAFELPGEADEPIQYSVDAGAFRVVVLDTTRPGEDEGELDARRLGWLEQELATPGDKPVLLAMHHPPLVTGVPVLDRLALPAPDRDALARVLAGHDEVACVLTGHLHRTISGRIGVHRVFVAASTYLQARLDFELTGLEFAGEPPGFAVHVAAGGEVATHTATV
jgi:3',5'-cyclic AMP phosphodiesterase CpdA